MKLKRLDIYVEPDIEKALAIAAAQDGRTMSNYVGRLLGEHVAILRSAKKEKREKTS
jgi:hypothetical protein